MKIVLALVLLGVVGLAFGGCGGGGRRGRGGWKGRGMKKLMKCKGTQGDFESFKSSMQECKSTFKSESHEEENRSEEDEEGDQGNGGCRRGKGKFNKAKFQKFMVCVYEKEGVIKHGKLDESGLKHFIKGTFPGSVGEELSTVIMDTCYTSEYTDNLDTSKPGSFRGFFECVKETWIKHCAVDEGGSGNEEE